VAAPALHDAQIDGRTPMALLSWDADAVNDVSEMIGPAFLPGKLDYARDPELHAWLEDAETSLNVAARKARYAQAIERITDQVYWLPLYTFVQNYGFADQLVFTPSLDGFARLYRVRWK
jgi:peptide/nickel transport system substrate-binding protein